MFELKFNLKLIKLVFSLYFDVLLKKGRREGIFGPPYTFHMLRVHIQCVF